MSARASRPSPGLAELHRLAESGALDSLAWALTGVLLSAAEHLAPEATTPTDAAWIVARRADPSLASPAGSARPLAGGTHPATHDDQVSELAGADLVVAEGDRRERLTSTAD